MFSVGERVMHPGQGLCTVVGFEDTPAPMLVLEAGNGRTTTRMLYPASQAGKLHPPVSRDEALAIIDGYGTVECDTFTNRNSGLEETHFKAMLKQGASDCVCVAKTMRVRIAAADAAGKKPSTFLARVLKEAQRRALEELACALEVTPEDVATMFEERGFDLAEEI